MIIFLGINKNYWLSDDWEDLIAGFGKYHKDICIRLKEPFNQPVLRKEKLSRRAHLYFQFLDFSNGKKVKKK